MAKHVDTEQVKIEERRSFLNYATGGLATVALGASGFGLLKSCAPSASVKTGNWNLKFNLTELVAGEPVTIKLSNVPVVLLRLTEDQIERSKAVSISDLYDQNARNDNLYGSSPASFENRTIDADGPILVLDKRCPRRGCVTMYDVGDYQGWFCPCYATHFDVLGRVRKGLITGNMQIPRLSVAAPSVLEFPQEPAPIDDKSLDRLIYGEPNQG
ncbi:MAG: ubiquinol-cytochrome c reductase iron-sulfur subunit [Paracoccaceae bacterium]